MKMNSFVSNDESSSSSSSSSNRSKTDKAESNIPSASIPQKQRKITKHDNDDDRSCSAEEFENSGRIVKDDNIMRNLEGTGNSKYKEENRESQIRAFMKRWCKEDRPVVTKLLRKFGVASYAWNEGALRGETPVVLAPDLLGKFDILFVHGEPDGMDQGYTDGPLARTVRSGTLTLEMQTTRDCDYFYYNANLEIVRGRIAVEKVQYKKEIHGSGCCK